MFGSILLVLLEPPDVSLNWRVEKKSCIIVLVSRVPDGHLQKPAERVSQQLLKCSVRKNTSDMA